MIITIISTIALMLSLAGNLLINMKKKVGFFVWIASNVCWIAVNFMSVPNYPQIIMYVVYAGLNVQGWVLWNKNKKGVS